MVSLFGIKRKDYFSILFQYRARYNLQEAGEEGGTFLFTKNIVNIYYNN